MDATGQTCLLWIHWWPMCMTRGEWASWMQALGALVALYVAISIARNAERARAAEVRDALERQRAAEKQRSDHANAIVRMYSSSVNAALMSMRDGAERQVDQVQMSRRAAVLKEAARVADAIEISDVASSDYQHVLNLRVISAEAVWAAEHVTTRSVTWQHWATQFQELETRVESELLALGGFAKSTAAPNTCSAVGTVT